MFLQSSFMAILLVIIVTFFIGTCDGQLAFRFYAQTCPNAESIVLSVVQDAIARDPTMAAALLRLHFHDCFVEVSLSYIHTYSTFPNSFLFKLSSLFIIYHYFSYNKWRGRFKPRFSATEIIKSYPQNFFFFYDKLSTTYLLYFNQFLINKILAKTTYWLIDGIDFDGMNRGVMVRFWSTMV